MYVNWMWNIVICPKDLDDIQNSNNVHVCSDGKLNKKSSSIYEQYVDAEVWIYVHINLFTE